MFVKKINELSNQNDITKDEIELIINPLMLKAKNAMKADKANQVTSSTDRKSNFTEQFVDTSIKKGNNSTGQYMEEILEHVAGIHSWVKFWSILSVIGLIIIFIVTCSGLSSINKYW